MSIHVYSHNFYSRGARALAEALDAWMIKHEHSRFLGRPRKIVINWGATELPQEVHKCTVLNGSLRTAYMTDKLKFFKLVEKCARIPPYTTDIKQAQKWRDKEHDVVERHILNGSGGRGIRLVTGRMALQQAPLYTRYVPKMSEFRLHFVGDSIIDIQRKAARRDLPKEQINWRIRNLDGGFIYARDGAVCPKDCKEQSLAAFRKSGLHFGAVDVIWNQEAKKAYVLEINTAPGLEGQTIENYATALRGLIQNEMRNMRF